MDMARKTLTGKPDMMTHAQQSTTYSPARHLPLRDLVSPMSFVHVARGSPVFFAGRPGHAWRLIEGCVRLDRNAYDKTSWAGLAIAGDIIGVETLFDRLHSWTATAITSCQLCAWQPNAADMTSTQLAHTLIRSESRMAEILALRVGRATDRIHRLLELLGATPMELPRLQDIADITDLTVATVSRTISSMQSMGILKLEGKQRTQRVTYLQRMGPLMPPHLAPA